MKNNYPYLKDVAFLKEFDELHNKEQFVKITVLDWKENPIQDIQGYVTGGTLNLDGSSSVRRTANLSLVVDEPTNDFIRIEQLLTINKKIELQVGFTNTLSKYKDFPILWFPLGVFVVFNPSFSHTTSSLAMSMQLKDKMCLLNGELGGVFSAPVIFNEREDFDEEGNTIITQPTIYQIITELINHFGGEQLGKIIIEDIPLKIKQVMKWNGSVPLYKYDTTPITNSTSKGVLFSLDNSLNLGNSFPQEYLPGRDIGYIFTDFVFINELTANAGDNICMILDKIKNTLGNFEYFYDIDGNFVFREIKNYLNTSYATTLEEQIANNGEQYSVDFSKDKNVYSFEDGTVVTSYSNSPQFNNIKNDFLVWGIRTSVTGQKLPIRYHLAIDEKPIVNKEVEYQAIPLYDEENPQQIIGLAPVLNSNNESKIVVYASDWRSQLYLQGLNAETLGLQSNDYYVELKEEIFKLYEINSASGKNRLELKNALKESDQLYELDHFLDFIDSKSKIGEFSIKNIGRRTKVINDDSINCLFEPVIPDVIICKNGYPDIKENEGEIKPGSGEVQEATRQGLQWTLVGEDIYSQLAVGGTYNGAYNLIKDLLYQYTNYNETVQLQTLPIYYLEPNSRIRIKDVQSSVNGDFIIKNMSLPLGINGTMSVSAIKALTKI